MYPRSMNEDYCRGGARAAIPLAVRYGHEINQGSSSPSPIKIGAPENSTLTASAVDVAWQAQAQSMEWETVWG